MVGHQNISLRSFCIVCRDSTPFTTPQMRLTGNVRGAKYMIVGACARCGRQKSTFISEAMKIKLINAGTGLSSYVKPRVPKKPTKPKPKSKKPTKSKPKSEKTLKKSKTSLSNYEGKTRKSRKHSIFGNLW